MKKILFFAGLLAFVTSCTDDELISSGSYNQELPNGISFNGAVVDAPESRGMLSYDETAKNFPFFWYAEKDRINVYAWGEVKINPTTPTAITESAWNSVPTAAVYKATQSKANGQFTAITDETTLVFADSTATNKKNAEATFAATYNATVTEVTFDKNKAIDTISIVPSVSLADQNYTATGGKNVTDYMPMYSVSQATQKAEYNSVGESVGLRFYRYGNILGFQSSGIDATYKSLFGKLDSIYVETLGNAKDTVKASALAWNNTAPTYRIVVGAPVDFKKSTITMAQGDTVSVVKAGYKSAWGDGDIAYVATMPVDRNNNKTEYYKVTYKFDNITFVKDSLTTTTDWADATNGVRNLSQAKLNMTDYNCLVVGNDANSKSLLVNSGDFDSIFKDSTNLKWNGGTALTAIDTLICKVALTEAQQKRLARFTNLKYLQLDATTSLAKGALACATSLKTLNMPKVTTIAEEFSATPLTALDSLLLPAYGYGDADVNALLITSNLKKVDMSAVESVTENFYNDAPLTFNGKTNLKEVKVKDGLKVEVPNFFKGTGLTKVEGKIDITNAPGIFENVTTLDSVAITGTVIPERAFSGATAIAKVAVNGAQVKPTTVGANAFYNTQALTTMDLSATTTIGANAFAESGLAYSAKDVALMTVGATTIGANAFENTALTKVDFKNATSVGNNILKGVEVTAVQFQKAFTVDESATTAWGVDMFGQNAQNKVTLYVAKDQKYVSGNSLLLPYVDGEGNTVTKKIDFLKITVAAQ